MTNLAEHGTARKGKSILSIIILYSIAIRSNFYLIQAQIVCINAINGSHGTCSVWTTQVFLQVDYCVHKTGFFNGVRKKDQYV